MSASPELGILNRVANTEASSTWTPARRLGFWVAILTAVLAAVAFGIGINTPPRSGPFCMGSCVTYPYTNAAAFVPGDYIWMYPGSFMVLSFVVLMACLYSAAPGDKKLFGQIGMSFALLAAAALILDYFIQLTVMQPSFLKGETEGLSLFSQYNPHGIFIALEDLGYLMMSAAFLFFSAIFAGRDRLARGIRWLYLASSLLAIGLFFVFSLVYGQDLEYRFEVTAITITWTTLVISGVLLSAWFRRKESHS